MEQLAHVRFDEGERGRTADVNNIAASVTQVAAHLVRHLAVDLDDADNGQGIILWGFEVTEVDAETLAVAPGAAIFPGSAGENAGKVAVALVAQQLASIPATAPAGARTDVIELVYTETNGGAENREVRSIVGGVPVINVVATSKRRTISAVAGRGEGRSNALGGRVRLATATIDGTGVTGVVDRRRHFLPAHGLDGGNGWKGVQQAIDALAELVADIKPRVDNVLDTNGKLKSSLEVSLGGEPIQVDAATFDVGARSFNADGQGNFQGVKVARSGQAADFQESVDLLKINGASVARAIAKAYVTLTWNAGTSQYDYTSMAVNAHGIGIVRTAAGAYTVTLNAALQAGLGVALGGPKFVVEVQEDPYTVLSGGADADKNAEAGKYITIRRLLITGDASNVFRVLINETGGAGIDRSFSVKVFGPVE